MQALYCLSVVQLPLVVTGSSPESGPFTCIARQFRCRAVLQAWPMGPHAASAAVRHMGLRVYTRKGCYTLRLAPLLLTLCCFIVGVLQSFVAGLTDLPDDVRFELQQLTPWTYVGNAAQQAKQLSQHLKIVK